MTRLLILMVFEILTFGFMQRALIAGIMIAIICSIIGLFLVLKRHSLFGDAMSHVAFGGIAIGLFTNVYPLWTAFIVSVLAALGMTKLREFAKIPADSAVAVLLSSGLAIGIVLISLSGGFTLDLFSFLFGSILLVSVQDLLMILIVSSIVLAIISLIYKGLTYVTFDEEQGSSRWPERKEHKLSFHSDCQRNGHCIDKVGWSVAHIISHSTAKHHCNYNGQGVQENCNHILRHIGLFGYCGHYCFLHYEYCTKWSYCSNSNCNFSHCCFGKTHS